MVSFDSEGRVSVLREGTEASHEEPQLVWRPVFGFDTARSCL